MLYDFTEFHLSKYIQSVVLTEREAQDGKHIGWQVLDKQHEMDVLGSVSSSRGQTGCY